VCNLQIRMLYGAGLQEHGGRRGHIGWCTCCAARDADGARWRAQNGPGKVELLRQPAQFGPEFRHGPSAKNRCVASLCSCLNSTKTLKECHCDFKLSIATECAAKGTNVEGWREISGCAAKCPAGFVHKDCHQSGCEKTCQNLSGQCGTTAYGSCFPGCYCPEGMVKNGNKCVTSDKCRNCKWKLRHEVDLKTQS